MINFQVKLLAQEGYSIELYVAITTPDRTIQVGSFKMPLKVLMAFKDFNAIS